MNLPDTSILRFRHAVYNESTIRKFIAKVRSETAYFSSQRQYVMCSKGPKGSYGIMCTDDCGEFCIQSNPFYMEAPSVIYINTAMKKVLGSPKETVIDRFMAMVVKNASTEELNAEFGKDTVKELTGKPANPFQQQINHFISGELERIRKEVVESRAPAEEVKAKAKAELTEISKKFGVDLS